MKHPANKRSTTAPPKTQQPRGPRQRESSQLANGGDGISPAGSGGRQRRLPWRQTVQAEEAAGIKEDEGVTTGLDVRFEEDEWTTGFERRWRR